MTLRASVLLALIFFGLFPFLSRAQEPLRGTITAGEVRCYLGTTEPENPQALKEGEVCQKVQVQCEGVEIPSEDKPVGWAGKLFAAVLAALPSYTVQQGYVTSVCQSGKCVATYGCDGKPLPGAPTLPKPTPTTPLPPNTSPTPIGMPGIPTPLPSSPTLPASGSSASTPLSPNTSPTPLPANTPVTMPRPNTTPGGLPPNVVPTSGGNGSATFPLNLDPNTSVFALPTNTRVGEVPSGALSPGGIFGSPYGNTFGNGTFGNSGGSGSSLFGNFLSSILPTVVSNLFSGFFGGNNSSPAQPLPAHVPEPPRATPPVIAHAPLPSPTVPRNIPSETSPLPSAQQTPPTPAPVSSGVPTSLPSNGESVPSSGATSPLPSNAEWLLAQFAGRPTPLRDITIPQQFITPVHAAPTPAQTSPFAVEDIAPIESSVPRASGAPVPQVAARVPDEYTTFVDTVLQDLQGNRPVDGAQFVVAHALAEAEVGRAREALEDRGVWERIADWVGIGSPQMNAYAMAEARLSELTSRYSLIQTAANAEVLQGETVSATTQTNSGGSASPPSNPSSFSESNSVRGESSGEAQGTFQSTVTNVVRNISTALNQMWQVFSGFFTTT